ncbi:GNAT family N-acetyltransferase [Chitinimonas lacunae]|uniref:GNAT family N-acetyltransferase n=1 Tax=Chitinimonas lacunae TaxID=1963018 RepID=A0ABV8MP47_9NEIS
MYAITQEDPDSPDARRLIDELSATLARIAGDNGPSPFDLSEARAPQARFVIARDASGQALGCGALRPIARDIAELKRMYARQGRNGVGSAMLKHLEEEARQLGYRALWLETRKINTVAVAFYQRHGYLIIPNFGKYAGRDDAVCFAKSL